MKNPELHDLKRFNSICKEPFVENGETYHSYLCKVHVDITYYYTYVYARNRTDAMDKLKEQYPEYFNHTIVSNLN